MSEGDLMQYANEIYACTALLLKLFSQSLEKRLQQSGAGMSVLHYLVLRMLQAEPLTSSTISQRMDLDPSFVVRIIDSLEQKGLAARGVDPRDRRRNPIQITEKGLELVAAIPMIGEDDPTFQALQSLGIEPAARLRDLMLKVIQQFPEGRQMREARPS